jgi:hypothetical protein
MPRFHFDLVGPKPVTDTQGLVFSDVQFAARVAEQLAADLFATRHELRGRASVVMSDGQQKDLVYCVAISDRTFKAA